MNKIIEATRTDGSKALLPLTLIRNYANEAKIAANGNSKKAMKYFGQMLANLMFVRGYTKLVEICYSIDMQTRKTLMFSK